MCWRVFLFLVYTRKSGRGNFLGCRPTDVDQPHRSMVFGRSSSGLERFKGFSMLKTTRKAKAELWRHGVVAKALGLRICSGRPSIGVLTRNTWAGRFKKNQIDNISSYPPKRSFHFSKNKGEWSFRRRYTPSADTNTLSPHKYSCIPKHSDCSNPSRSGLSCGYFCNQTVIAK